MEIVKDFEFAVRGNRGKYAQLYKDLVELPYGTAVKCTKGEDFDVEPAKFAISLRAGLWNKGYRVKVAVRGDDVYALVVGPRNAPEGGA